MTIESYVEGEALCDYFFIEGTIEVDSEYFINEIKKGINKKDNMNFKTNVRDHMTSYKYFNNDLKFKKILTELMRYVDEKLSLPEYDLRDSWGYCIRTHNETKLHNHSDLFSGVLYLNNHNQTLDFPSINRKVKPQKGKFALFSSFLKHEAKKHESKETKWGISFNLADNWKGSTRLII